MTSILSKQNLPLSVPLSDPDSQRAIKMTQRILSLCDEEMPGLFRRYYALLSDFSMGVKPVSLDPKVDALWHIHILDMKRYQLFCKKHFGRIIYHELPDQPLELDWLAQERPNIKYFSDTLTNKVRPEGTLGFKTAIAASSQCSEPA